MPHSVQSFNAATADNEAVRRTSSSARTTCGNYAAAIRPLPTSPRTCRGGTSSQHPVLPMWYYGSHRPRLARTRHATLPRSPRNAFVAHKHDPSNTTFVTPCSYPPHSRRTLLALSPLTTVQAAISGSSGVRDVANAVRPPPLALDSGHRPFQPDLC